MITENLIEQYYRLLVHKDAQKYAESYFEGNEVKYPHSKNYLTNTQLVKALEGKKTIGVFLSQDKTSLVKAGAIDIDTPRDAENLAEAYALAKHIQTLALSEFDIQLEIEFSGNRGYHLWLFSETPITAQLMLDCFKVICLQVNFDCKEYFPNKVPESKCIKLPGVTHLKSKRKCGFVDTNHNPNKIELPNQYYLLKTFKQNTVERIDKIANSLIVTDEIEEENRECDLSSFGNEHPSCIKHLLVNGVPLEIDYNAGNLTLARYCLSKGLNHQESLALAKKMAESTKESHTTSKDYQGKITNFESVYKSVTSHGYKFKCSYILAKKGNQSLASRGCIGKECKACDFTHKNESINPKTEIQNKPVFKPYNALIFQVIVNLSSEGKEVCKSLILEGVEKLFSDNPDLLSTTNLDNFSDSQILQESEVLANFLLTSANLSTYLDLPYLGFNGGSELPLPEYLDCLLTLKLPSEDTIKSHIERIRERGIRVIAHQKVTEFKADKETPISQSLDTLITDSEKLLKKAISDIQIQPMINHIPLLTENLFSNYLVSIPSPSSHLNIILNGGFMPGKLYVIGAPPGSGKSTFCAYCGDYAASNGTKVIYISYEMSREQLWIASLARIESLNSAVIESRKFLDYNYHSREILEERLKKAIVNYSEKIASNLIIIEADVDYTPVRLKGIAKKSEADLIIIDYLQLLNSGDDKIDSGNQETVKVSRIATELKRLARDTNTAVIAISDINKTSYLTAIVGGDLDMSALRDSFKIAHSADCILLMQSGKISIGKGDNKQTKDQLDLLADKYPDKQREIDRIKTKYPIDQKLSDCYSRLTIVKNRGGKKGEPLFKYSRALHNFHPLDFNVDINDENEL